MFINNTHREREREGEGKGEREREREGEGKGEREREGMRGRGIETLRIERTEESKRGRKRESFYFDVLTDRNTESCNYRIFV